ncbi:MaoC family dehydratase N-terminal domain-containing protein [Rhizorhabdus sp.]|uniref:FAS1-like dehydratase domain-containing protein n=1 Tax=Rhizorhabdus sp. TaxID=1968843 RepID=UPI0025E2EB6D|nr:MaoC family dehydratase N-terminal domain-containing protein [Rhizorhabdus sp.]
MGEARMTRQEGLIIGKITDEDVEKMRKRIHTVNPTLRKGWLRVPFNPTANLDAIRRWSIMIGDDNPLYTDAAHARASRWQGVVAPPGFEWSTGWDMSPYPGEELERSTRGALRGVQLFHSGAEYFFYRPISDGDEMFKSEWLDDVTEKTSSFGKRSVLVNNANCFWNQRDEVSITSSRWFVHVERGAASERKERKEQDAAPFYSEEELAEIEAAYDGEYRRGSDTLYVEDVAVGDALPVMVKGPLTITDMINMHMGGGWFTYGNPPFKLAHENRKRLRGFYSRDAYNNWDTVQRVHWDGELANKVGVQRTYDIGPMRYVFVCHFLTNFVGDDAFIHRIRYELRAFNYVGDVTWLTGRILEARTDPELGPLIEVEITGTNQRGQQNITATATVLVASRAGGLAKLPPSPAVTPYRSGQVQ